MDIAGWLRSLGLEEYEAVFRENKIDDTVLPSLTAEDLKDLGIGFVGHRRKLLAAIASLGAAPPAATVMEKSRDGPTPLDAERRQLTVMFCDLVGSTELSTRLDPEDLREVIAAYHRTVADVVRSFDGYVAKYMGDGVLVYFGYPRAHEDDAERAVRAGLNSIEAVGRLDVVSAKLQARVGIATGLVVVGDLIGEGAAQEQSVVGETPNLAARLQALAEPDAVVIAATTRRLVGDLFEYHDLAAVEVKGIAGPVSAWQVLRPSVVESRFEALRGSALSPLVGRDEEIDLLLRRWTRAKAGDGQVVLISGEPGLGKSRLTAALIEYLHRESHIQLRYFCSPYHQDTALFPFIDQFARAVGFAPDDPPATKRDKLEALLSRAPPPKEDLALIADLLSLPVSERRPLPNLSPQQKKERTLEALIRRLEVLAHLRPVIMVFEDAHWIDPTSRELLDLAVERVRSLPVLMIVTFRTEFQSPWTGQPQVSLLALNRLDRHDRTTLVEQIAGGKALPEEIITQIADRTDGVPLFIEELTKSVLESGMPMVGIPATLRDLLMARLDRMASARRVAQIGASIGRDFSYELLRAVSRLPEDELKSALARLVASALVLQRGTPPDAVYAFKHALVQDAAHGSLLRSARQRLHAQIAAALESQSPELMENQPELFAQHYAEAGLAEEAVAYWSKAGRRSAARSAMAEAAAQLQKGLDQLALLPKNPERQRQELEICSSLGAVLLVVKGYAAADTGRAYARAQELWEQLDSPSDFFHVPYGRSSYHVHRGELDLAMRLDESLLRLSCQRNDSAGLVLGHLSSGRNLMVAGKFASSRSQLEEVVALYSPISHRSLGHLHPLIASQAYLGNVLFCLGFPDQALARDRAAIAEARRLAHPPSLAVSLAVGARLLALVGDSVALDERAGQLVALATEQGFRMWCAQGTIYRGWAKFKNGDVIQGISLIRSGLAGYRATGAQMWIPHYIALLAMACESVGQIEDALSLSDDSLQMAENTGESWFAAELNRYKGGLLQGQGNSGAAEEIYRKALSIAQQQGAKLWELRVAASLARLWRDQGRRAEARNILKSVFGWFTEGFHTPDLKEAKALLDELAS